jgi:predicted house-cleaning noncanonical NTP pyrophosphatase (MazG superfamily)
MDGSGAVRTGRVRVVNLKDEQIRLVVQHIEASSDALEQAAVALRTIQYERDALAALVDAAVVRCVRQPGAKMPVVMHALDAAIDALLDDRDRGYGRTLPRIVRDRIPERLGHPLRRATPEERVALLKKKLVEEAHELLAAEDDAAVAGELADAVEVILQLAAALRVDLAVARLEKGRERGGYVEGWVLEEVVVPPWDTAADAAAEVSTEVERVTRDYGDPDMSRAASGREEGGRS